MTATDAGPSPQPPQFRDAATQRRFRVVLLVFFCFTLLNKSLFYDLEATFIMSIVSCSNPTPPCPSGTQQSGEVCVAEPRHSPTWSFSKHCPVRAHVLNSSRTTMSSMASADSVASILALFILGPLTDRIGRKPMVLLSIAGATLRVLMQYSSTLLIGQPEAQELVNVAGAFLGNLLGIENAAFAAMAADLSEAQLELRGLAMARLSLVGFVAGASGFSAGFLVLYMNLESYAWFWLLSAGLNVILFLFVAFGLQETLPQRAAPEIAGERDPAEGERSVETFATMSSSSSTVDGHQEAKAHPGALGDLRAFLADVFCNPVLLQLLVIVFLFTLPFKVEHLGRYILLTYMGYSQASASLVGVVGTACGLMGTKLNTLILARLRAWTTLFVACILGVFGSLLEGFSIPLAPAPVSSAIFWTGRAALGLGRGLHVPLLHTIASMQLGPQKQGRLFCTMQVTELLARVFGMSLMYRQLFNSSWTGWLAGISCFVGAAIYTLLSVWVLILGRTQRETGGSKSEQSEGPKVATV